ncbi:hypothetical protein Tco_0103093 [Tanacetum coccineum]
MPKFVYEKKTSSTPIFNSFSAIEEANEKSMDDLVDDTWKKMEAPPKKALRRLTFGRDDMDFDDMEQTIEEVEHMNAYSKNG